MNKRTVIISTLLGAAFAGILTAMLMQSRHHSNHPPIEYRTRVEVRHDTVVKVNPISTITTRHDTVVRLLETVVESCDTAPDTIAVKVPIEHKVWQDSNYRVAASGYEINLDTVEIFRTSIHTTMQPVFAKEKQSRWGISATAGVGISPAGITPFIGIGVSYTFFSF